MTKYNHAAKQILEAIGGKDNIQSLTHCMTRLRMVLFNQDRVDQEAIESLSCVKGTAYQSGQYQIIIGNDVQALFDVLQSLMGENNKEEVKVNLLHHGMQAIAEIFAPLIPAIICGGLLLGLAQWSGPDLGWLFTLLGKSVFTYMPVGIIYGVTCKLKGTPILGMILGIVLCLEQIGYAGSVSVAILAGICIGLLEKSLRKFCPENISMLFVPLISLVLSSILTIKVLGPLGNGIDQMVSLGLSLIFQSPIGLVISFGLGIGYIYLVMSGMHHITLPLDLIFISRFGFTMLWPLLALCNIAQASSTLGMFVLQYKNKQLRKRNRDACVSCYMGVSEPALFGVNQKYHYPLIAGMLGSGFACLFANYFQIKAFSIGIGGLAGIFSVVLSNWLAYLGCMAVSIIVPFSLTLLMGWKSKKKQESFVSPATGIIHSLDQVPDTVFASGMMGEGFAIELLDDTVYAPMSGEVSMVFPTKHAYGLKLIDGSEILIHIGLDTVELNGQGFSCQVSPGTQVKQGDILCIVDREFITSQGKSLWTPIVWTDHQSIHLYKMGKVSLLEAGIVESKHLI